MSCAWKYALRVNCGAEGLRQDGLGHQHCLCEYDDVCDGDDNDDDDDDDDDTAAAAADEDDENAMTMVIMMMMIMVIVFLAQE